MFPVEDKIAFFVVHGIVWVIIGALWYYDLIVGAVATGWYIASVASEYYLYRRRQKEKVIMILEGRW